MKYILQENNYFPRASNKAIKTKHKAPKKDSTLKNIKYFLPVLRYQSNANNAKSTITWMAQKWNGEIMSIFR